MVACIRKNKLQRCLYSHGHRLCLWKNTEYCSFYGTSLYDNCESLDKFKGLLIVTLHSWKQLKRMENRKLRAWQVHESSASFAGENAVR